ncbi:MAG TPA: cytochrome c oxidase subunit 2A [Sphingomicrobium sp.]|jgi:Cytochrome c oxidase subunit IIa family.|nr:cytochrome c oxidase subunit 2A [Sphingomicrobium sp.]
MTEPAYPVTRHDYADDAQELERLEESLEGGPKGAVTVSLIAVLLLMVGWLGMYFLVFLPRGTVG